MTSSKPIGVGRVNRWTRNSAERLENFYYESRAFSIFFRHDMFRGVTRGNEVKFSQHGHVRGAEGRSAGLPRHPQHPEVPLLPLPKKGTKVQKPASVTVTRQVIAHSVSLSFPLTTS